MSVRYLSRYAMIFQASTGPMGIELVMSYVVAQFTDIICWDFFSGESLSPVLV